MAERRLIEDVGLVRAGAVHTDFPVLSVLSPYLRKKMNRLVVNPVGEEFTLFVEGLWWYGYAQYLGIDDQTGQIAANWLDHQNAYGEEPRARAGMYSFSLVLARGDCLIAPRHYSLRKRYVRVVTLDAVKMSVYADWAVSQFGDDPFPVVPTSGGPTMYGYCEDPDHRARDNKLLAARLAFG